MAQALGKLARWFACGVTCVAWFTACSGTDQHRQLRDEGGEAGQLAGGNGGKSQTGANGGQAAGGEDIGAAGLAGSLTATGGASDGGGAGNVAGDGTGALEPPVLCDAVVFTDTHLEDIMRSVVGVQTGAIPPEKAAAATFAFTSSLLVGNLDGMECFTGLTRFEAASNTIVDLAPLKGLKRLKYLALGGNKIVDLSPLAGLTELEVLQLNNNGKLADISALKDLTKLTQLELGNNPLITDIGVLADKVALQILDLHFDVDITNIDAIAELSALTKLLIGEIPIVDDGLLADKLKLNYLDAAFCGLSSAAFLADLSQMQTLVLQGNPISDISVTQLLTKLDHVNLDSTMVTDITPLANNAGLTKGDSVFVQQMSFADCQAHLAAAQALIDRGVTVLAQCP